MFGCALVRVYVVHTIYMILRKLLYRTERNDNNASASASASVSVLQVLMLLLLLLQIVCIVWRDFPRLVPFYSTGEIQL